MFFQSISNCMIVCLCKANKWHIVNLKKTLEVLSLKMYKNNFFKTFCNNESDFLKLFKLLKTLQVLFLRKYV